MEKMIECELITGEKKLVPANELIFRPAVYAIIEKNGQLLLVNTKSTGRWFFPGGAIEKGELVENSLHREVLEETGIEIGDISFFTLKESFFYYAPHNTAYHCLNFFFTASPQSESPVNHKQNDQTDEADKYEWVDIKSLNTSDMQSFAGEVLEKYKAL